MYSGPVTIHFTCTDALSGIVPTTGCPADQVVSSSGTTTVSGTATDKAGNTMTASITVTVKQVCEQEQDTLDRRSARTAATPRGATPSDCATSRTCSATSVTRHGATATTTSTTTTVTVASAISSDAAQSLRDLRGIQSVPSSVIDGWIDNLSNSSRVIAGTALDDANSSHGSAYWISRAQSELAAGDTSHAANDDVGAIGHYQNAWQYAQNA